MIERIKKLADMVVKGEMFIDYTETEFDRNDIFLSPIIMQAKQTKEYILNQKPYVNEYTAMTGYLRFAGEKITGDIFTRSGHENFRKVRDEFYLKPVDGLCAFEWQHSVADFEKVINVGIDGLRKEIEESKGIHTANDEREFLEALTIMCDAICEWAKKCSAVAYEMSNKVESAEAKENLVKLSNALCKVPQRPAETFYEAVLAIYMIYAFVPDSIGTVDRYLYPFYKKDIDNGSLTSEEAKSYLQELFLMLQSRLSIKSDRFYRGGESHFCIGGYLENGEDGFNDLSKLVLDSMLELPTWVPQISLRWTKKTPREVLRYVMDCERKDPNKRIAFVNDEMRIKALMELAGFDYKLACRYTMVGCNEPQLPGGIFMGGCDTNIAKSIERTFFDRKEEVCAAKTFDEFYNIYEDELCGVLDDTLGWYNKFQKVRARDVNLVSTMFFEGSIKRAKSITQGGAENAIANLNIMGIVTVIDSLAMIKQFVFDEKKYSMKDICEALGANWSGYESIRGDIIKNGDFFGNNGDIANECGDRFSKSLGQYFWGKKSDMGYSFLVGNLIGYNQYHKWFGDCTKATPDGRYEGDMISFGIGQNDGKDREGLTALLTSVSKMNNHLILCGATVTNVLLDETLVGDDENFEKTVMLFESYFMMGGLHFQLNYVSPEVLKEAKTNPEKHRSLRVRVSGFSDYFSYLNEDLQDEIIKRTSKKA